MSFDALAKKMFRHYEVGDRVRTTFIWPDVLTDKTGTILEITEGSDIGTYLVVLDDIHIRITLWASEIEHI